MTFPRRARYAVTLTSLLLMLLVPSFLAPPAPADQHRSSITGQKPWTARDLLEKRSEYLSGREERLLRDIQSGSKDQFSPDERALFDPIQRKLPDTEGSEGGD